MRDFFRGVVVKSWAALPLDRINFRVNITLKLINRWYERRVIEVIKIVDSARNLEKHMQKNTDKSGKTLIQKLETRLQNQQ